MRGRRGGRGRLSDGVIVTIAASATMAITGCRGSSPPATASQAPAVLRVGVAQLAALTSPLTGWRQLSQNLSVDNLLRVAENGRLEPSLADRWTTESDGRTVRLHIRTGVTFHDGSPLDAAAVKDILPSALQPSMGPVADAVDRIDVAGEDVLIRFHEPSPFVLEGLEAPIKKPGSAMIGTGPFIVAANSTMAMEANRSYYQGPPAIGRIEITSYPSVRAAWADLLRDRLDMLYDVGTDALDSLEASKSVSTFTYTRHYQFVFVLSAKSPALRPKNVRVALNKGIDRSRLVKNALGGHGVASSQPVAPAHWALSGKPIAIEYDPRAAVGLLQGERKNGARLRFVCLIPPDTLNERIALELKSQLAAIDVEMVVEEASQEQIGKRIAVGDFDAALLESISGPTLLRPYLFWHTGTAFNPGGIGNKTVDAALDRVRHAPSENSYKEAVVALEQAFVDDPPAIFVAWSVRARAVSKRFDVPAEEGRDIIGSLRLFRPTDLTRTQASRN